MELEQYKKVQGIAKKVLASVKDLISEQDTEKTIAEKAEGLLSDFGAPDTWYHDVPAFVLLGTRSCLSISGRQYVPSLEKVGSTNLITVDLSPCIGDVWGDCARSFVVENGEITYEPSNEAFSEGLAVQSLLHQRMTEFVTPDTRFSQLFKFGNDFIKECGYQNLDFHSNLGHSIEKCIENRSFIDIQCHALLSQVSFFTFEPHIRKKEGSWGFKHENIYYFDNEGNVVEL
ncbi:MAG: aminopeptidase P family protein [Planctomycetes bacterium]|nr:aminopeptidase P family protein [Planctomycetota bacterium]